VPVLSEKNPCIYWIKPLTWTAEQGRPYTNK